MKNTITKPSEFFVCNGSYIRFYYSRYRARQTTNPISIYKYCNTFFERVKRSTKYGERMGKTTYVII